MGGVPEHTVVGKFARDAFSNRWKGSYEKRKEEDPEYYQYLDEQFAQDYQERTGLSLDEAAAKGQAVEHERWKYATEHDRPSTDVEGRKGFEDWRKAKTAAPEAGAPGTAAPDITDDKLMEIRKAQARSLLAGRGRRSMFLSPAPKRPTFLGGG